MTDIRTLLAEKYGERTVTSLDDFVVHTEMAARLVALGKDEFLASEFATLAAEAVAIRLGESVNRTNKEFLTDYRHLNLRPIVSTRHVIARGYDIINHERLWSAYEKLLPQTADAVRALLAGDESAPPGAAAGLRTT